jgi:hypothetical protein
LAAGALLCGAGAVGYLSLGEQAAAGWDGAAVTDDIVRSWMMMTLFSSLAGAMAVTREFSTDTMARSVLAAGGRRALLRAKLVAILVVGAGFAVLTVLVAAVSAAGLVGMHGHPVVWTADITRTLLGVGACVLLSALWGQAIGWLVRHQTAAALVIVIVTVGLEPALARLVPSASAYLFTIALSSIYRDGKPYLLPVGAATLVAVAWILVLGLAARRSFERRELR